MPNDLNHLAQEAAPKMQTKVELLFWG